MDELHRHRDRWRTHGVPPLVALGLEIDRVQAQRVFVDDAVHPTVA